MSLDIQKSLCKAKVFLFGGWEVDVARLSNIGARHFSSADHEKFTQQEMIDIQTICSRVLNSKEGSRAAEQLVQVSGSERLHFAVGFDFSKDGSSDGVYLQLRDRKVYVCKASQVLRGKDNYFALVKKVADVASRRGIGEELVPCKQTPEEQSIIQETLTERKKKKNSADIVEQAVQDLGKSNLMQIAQNVGLVAFFKTLAEKNPMVAMFALMAATVTTFGLILIPMKCGEMLSAISMKHLGKTLLSLGEIVISAVSSAITILCAIQWTEHLQFLATKLMTPVLMIPIYVIGILSSLYKARKSYQMKSELEMILKRHSGTKVEREAEAFRWIQQQAQLTELEQARIQSKFYGSDKSILARTRSALNKKWDQALLRGNLDIRKLPVEVLDGSEPSTEKISEVVQQVFKTVRNQFRWSLAEMALNTTFLAVACVNLHFGGIGSHIANLVSPLALSIFYMISAYATMFFSMAEVRQVAKKIGNIAFDRLRQVATQLQRACSEPLQKLEKQIEALEQKTAKDEPLKKINFMLFRMFLRWVTLEPEEEKERTANPAA